MRTLNQIVKSFQSFATNHLQIQRSSFGFFPKMNDDINDEGNNLPYFYIQAPIVTMSENYQDFNFTIYVLDAKQKDNENSQDALSDTLSIVDDFRKWCTYNYTNNGFATINTEVITAEPVNNFTNDWLVGWKIAIIVTVTGIPDDCDIPLSAEVENTDDDPLIYHTKPAIVDPDDTPDLGDPIDIDSNTRP